MIKTNERRFAARAFAFATLICFLYFVFPLLAQDGVENEFDIITYYYLNSHPNKIPILLEQFLNSEQFKNDENFREYNVDNAAYLFGRIAQLEPGLITKYEDLFDKSSHDGRIFLLKVFQICGDEQVRNFLLTKLKDKNFSEENDRISKIIEKGIPIELNPLTREVSDASDLDFLWAEFVITGDENAVKKIISVLGWPDRFRKKLSDYLKSAIAKSEKEAIVNILDKDYNVKCDISAQLIDSFEDLDIFISSHLQSQKDRIERFQKICKALNLTEKDILYMAIKGSAEWSLASNAQQHKKVFEICDMEIRNYAGSAKIKLLRIAAQGYTSNNKTAEVIDRLKNLSSLLPKDKDAHYRLGLIYAESGDMQSALKESNILKNLDIAVSNKLDKEINYAMIKYLDKNDFIESKNPINTEEAIEGIAKALEDIKSYQSRLVIRNYTNEKLKAKDYVFIEWRFGSEKRDRLTVEQYANDNDSSTYDMWTSIDGNHYNLLPVLGWIKEKDANLIKNKNRLHYELSLEKYIKLLKQNKASSISLFESNQGTAAFYVIKYDLPEWDFFTFDIKEVKYFVELWVDKNSLLLNKALIRLNAKEEESKKDIVYIFTQLFANYDNVTIQAPLKVYDDKKCEFMNPEELQEINRW